MVACKVAQRYVERKSQLRDENVFGTNKHMSVNKNGIFLILNIIAFYRVFYQQERFFNHITTVSPIV